MRTRPLHKLIPFALVSALMFGACGIKGELETAPPLWGDKSKPGKKQKQKSDNGDN